MIELCEWCGKLPGAINSRYWTVSDGSYDGHWVCGNCEYEFEMKDDEENALWVSNPDEEAVANVKG